MRTLLLAATLLAPVAARAATNDTIIPCAGQDATAAIQASLNLGGITHLTGGVCTLSAGLVMTVNGTVLNGAGRGVTILQSAVPDAFVLVTVGGATRVATVTGARMWALTLDGNAPVTGAPIPGIGETGVLVKNGSEADINNIEVENMPNGGVHFGGSGSIVNSYVHMIGQNGIYVEGVALPGHPVFPAGPVRIVGNTVADVSQMRPVITSAGVTWDGIDCDPWHTGCDIENNKVTGKDILLLDETGYPSGNDTVSGNTVTGSNEAGIDVAGGIVGFVVENNTLVNDENNSIVVGGPAQNGVISGNVIVGGGPIVVHAGAINVTVSP